MGQEHHRTVRGALGQALAVLGFVHTERREEHPPQFLRHAVIIVLNRINEVRFVDYTPY